jgi:hypothetical protein
MMSVKSKSFLLRVVMLYCHLFKDTHLIFFSVSFSTNISISIGVSATIRTGIGVSVLDEMPLGQMSERQVLYQMSVRIL